MNNYNSFDTPENTFEVKRVLNQVNEHKRLSYQKHKYSSFESANIGAATTGDSASSAPSNFYLNREQISVPLETHKNEVIPIHNDW